MDLEGHTHKIYGCRHTYEGFYEKSTYQMSINMGRMTKTQGAHTSLVGILFFSSLSLSVKSFEEEIQPLKTVWIPLEARNLNSFKNSFKGTL